MQDGLSVLSYSQKALKSSIPALDRMSRARRVGVEVKHSVYEMMRFPNPSELLEQLIERIKESASEFEEHQNATTEM